MIVLIFPETAKDHLAGSRLKNARHGDVGGLADQTTRVVLHGHCRSRWEKLQSDGIASRADVPYGTPEMAREVQRLFRETDVRTHKIFAMSGHAEGVVAIGGNFEEALAVLALTGS